MFYFLPENKEKGSIQDTVINSALTGPLENGQKGTSSVLHSTVLFTCYEKWLSWSICEEEYNRRGLPWRLTMGSTSSISLYGVASKHPTDPCYYFFNFAFYRFNSSSRVSLKYLAVFFFFKKWLRGGHATTVSMTQSKRAKILIGLHNSGWLWLYRVQLSPPLSIFP